MVMEGLVEAPVPRREFNTAWWHSVAHISIASAPPSSSSISASSSTTLARQNAAVDHSRGSADLRASSSAAPRSLDPLAPLYAWLP